MTPSYARVFTMVLDGSPFPTNKNLVCNIYPHLWLAFFSINLGTVNDNISPEIRLLDDSSYEP
jgi:membrane-associated protease RseP (regulator of RpoE activity)